MGTVYNYFEKILCKRFKLTIKEYGQLRDEQFGFRPKHSTTLQLACLVEIVNRIFDERRLTGALFSNVAKAFDNMWVRGLLYKLTVLNIPSSLVTTVTSYLDCRAFQTSFPSATSTRRVMWAGVAQARLPYTLQPVCTPHTHTIPPRRLSAVRRQYSYRSHVS
jgi:hypothetical protein